ncbi:CAP domain-containing protein [Strongyloides ratti]|uniref:CAP domain-containing protein n=1 Tax=Strongyloides ratti TaxID=34506 RepID=A0A090LSS1_STRRB|nr:CAP domain-containing protein [Strongyloides ratti]CEF70649.1 CAP domain-containing protein [Strongyloides ratti]
MKFFLTIIRIVFILIYFINGKEGNNLLSYKHNILNRFNKKTNNVILNSKKILFLLIDGKPLFQCNYYIFKKLNDAVKYCNLLSSHSISRFIKPYGGIKYSTIKSYSSKRIVSMYDYKEVLLKQSFVPQIWKKAWTECDYDCFIENDFKQLKYRFIGEINQYRQLHNIKPLVENANLDKLARLFAYKKSVSINRYKINVTQFGVLSLVENTFVVNLVIKKLFSSFFGHYDYNNNKYSEEFNKQTQMLWKSTKVVGIGVAENSSLAFVVLLFYPKGNINMRYKENIPLVNDKYINYPILFNARG